MLVHYYSDLGLNRIKEQSSSEIIDPIQKQFAGWGDSGGNYDSIEF